jgi:tetratricopeptide (TPR) repeat protein
MRFTTLMSAAAFVAVSAVAFVAMSAAALVAASPQPAAQQPTTQSAPSSDARPATLLAGIQGVHFPISTRREEAQKFFDQGLALVYASNQDEAIRSFRKAADIDPGSPMPHWGIALAYGDGSGQSTDVARLKSAYDAVQHAIELAVRAPAKERAYVAALAKRYSSDPTSDGGARAVDYKDAMRQLTRTYPNDTHAATLYAASLMALHPGALWTVEGTPAEGTTEVVDVLERVLEREPDHVGANHYYIHATESSLTPERGLKSAKKLETLMPAAGHLLHMPAHIYMRTGNYSAAVTTTSRAADVDRASVAGLSPTAIYPSLYATHNLAFLASAAMMAGRFSDAVKAAQELTDRVTPILGERPVLEPLGAQLTFVLVRFAKWNDVLALPAPSEKTPMLLALHHFGRGMAQAALGNMAEAEKERDAYRAAQRRVPASTQFNHSAAVTILTIAERVLDARIIATHGDGAATVAAWKKAVEAEDQLGYSEPPDWFYPVRESLGVALTRVKRYEEADLAFREDLERNPNNGRSLWGRWQTLRASDGDVAGTQVVRRRFEDAWSDADTTLRLEDF